ncbi:MAG: TfoX/Sxy family DNA transformation protein [Chloroflexi bacterium]|nr:TfoX/Sxy family DNA transformation protein [Chloroflexota bacterium]
MTRGNGELKRLELESLKNLGPVSSRQLRAVGIETVEQLEAIGPARAFHLVADLFPSETSVTFLYALQGALWDVYLNQIPNEEKERLRRAVRDG